jgi:hypothetical protein
MNFAFIFHNVLKYPQSPLIYLQVTSVLAQQTN